MTVGPSDGFHNDNGPGWRAETMASPYDNQPQAIGNTAMNANGKRQFQADSGDVESSGANKKQRVPRSRMACLPCRSRKSKCGTVPPNTCAACIELGLQCVWPAEDGRSATARQRRIRGGTPYAAANQMVPVGTPSYALTPGSQAHHPGHIPPIDGFETLDVEAIVDQATLASFWNPAQSGNSWRVDVPTSSSAPNLTDILAPSVDAARSRMAKITWRRPHGQTAIAPGFKRITLKVRVNAPGTDRRTPLLGAPPVIQGQDANMLEPDGTINTTIMRHLLDVFQLRLGSLFPFLERAHLERQLNIRRGSRFLFAAIAAVAARFSTHPEIALPHLKPHQYGTVFSDMAKTMTGSMLAVPSRETVAALALLALVGAGDDSESEVWMFLGMAVRMSLDLGLHMINALDPDISEEECRRNRLLFWSVFMLDCALSFGVGRQTTFPLTDVTQALPSEEDISPVRFQDCDTAAVRSPFPFVATLFHGFAPLINLLNCNPAHAAQVEGSVRSLRSSLEEEYNLLPTDMTWNVTNFRTQIGAGNTLIYSWLHLWVNAILTNEALRPSEHGGHPQPQSFRNGTGGAWQNAARIIIELITAAGTINPYAYLAIPLVNQTIYVAACFYVREIEELSTRAASSGAEEVYAMAFRKIRTNILTLRSALEGQTKYWCGIAWITGSLNQQIEGLVRNNLDLEKITGSMSTSVSLPDEGLIEEHASSVVDVTEMGAQEESGIEAPSSMAFPAQDQTWPQQAWNNHNYHA